MIMRVDIIFVEETVQFSRKVAQFKMGKETEDGGLTAGAYGWDAINIRSRRGGRYAVGSGRWCGGR